MIVLHALWENDAEGRLHLWAESSAQAGAAFLRQEAPGKRTLPHPFALPAGELEERVGAHVGALALHEARQTTLALRLPSLPSAPLSSPELLLDEGALSTQKPPSLRWWNVPTLTLPAASALDLLLKLPAIPEHGTAYGAALRFWMSAASLALEFLTRQCYVPTLQKFSHGKNAFFYAAWEMLLSSEDQQRVQHLARLMPPLCWSFTPPGEKPATLPHTIVKDFLNEAIDAFVREQLDLGALLPARRTTPPLPEQWLQALASKQATLSAPVAVVAPFAEAVHAWLKQLQPQPPGAAFRTCFRLDAPAEAEEAGEQPSELWHISYHLQATSDPSLLVPAEQVWQERSGTLTFLKHTFANPQEHLLADLGRASRLFPALEISLNTAHPRALTLNNEQAYAFLRETAPLLEQSGFGVLVPPWWQKRSTRLGMQMKLKSAAQISASLLNANSLVSYDWNVAIGETILSSEEFARLVHLKQPLVRVRGQWVELRPEQVDAAINFFRKKAQRQKISLGEALRMGLGEEMNQLGLPVVGVEAEGELKDVFDRLTQNVPLETIEVPATFQGQLRPYQLKGVSWLAFLKQFGFGACLADDMGMGKTPSLIALLLYERMRNPQVLPSLVICPMSIVGNWQRELQRFAPSLSVLVHHGADRLGEHEFEREVRQHDVVLTTYTLALRDKELLAGLTWEHIVLDEAQNIKNEGAKQTQAIRQLQGRQRIALTGTPVENRLAELRSIMDFLNPGYLGSESDFRKRFSVPIERYRNAESAERLKRLIQPFVLRRVKTDKTIIADLPEKLELKVFCNLTQEQASLYQAVVKDMLEKIESADGIERKGLILSALMKLKQICNHPAHFMGDGSSLVRRSGKLERLEEMLEEVIANGEKALIFTQFAEMGTLLRRYLQEERGYETLFLHGGVEKRQRDLLVRRFQEERSAAPLFLLSLKAGGVGLNLTAANHVFHFDRWWNPAVENQATDRAFRIGQAKNVLVHKFICVGTLEERIDQMIDLKRELAENVVGAGENWLTELSTSQLKDLFTLSRDAVAV